MLSIVPMVTFPDGKVMKSGVSIGTVAQWEKHRVYIPGVVGSIPTRPTMIICHFAESFQTRRYVNAGRLMKR